jgi:cytosine deaminase
VSAAPSTTANPSGATPSAASDAAAVAARLAADGYLVLPAFAEPHAHLDKALLAERVPNPRGDLMGAILAMRDARPSITVADTVARAERAARLMVANGTTAIRTHADTTPENGLTSVEALIEVRERLRDIVDIQVVALTGFPSIGVAGDRARGLLRDAIAMGVDVVGGCPHLELDPAECNDLLLTIAAEAGLPVDLHTDETLDASICGLADLAERVLASGFPHAVTASHCVSLGVQPEARQRAVADRVAAAGIHVVALPQTNLFLQGRQQRTSTPRGITAVRALMDAGVHVAAGADNLQDPFNPVGRGDALETASLMISAAHLLPDEALAAVSTHARCVLGIPGDGDLVALPAASVREAIAFGPSPRVVVRHGAVLQTR